MMMMLATDADLFMFLGMMAAMDVLTGNGERDIAGVAAYVHVESRNRYYIPKGYEKREDSYETIVCHQSANLRKILQKALYLYNNKYLL